MEKLKILIIDDDVNHCDSLRDVLSSEELRPGIKVQAISAYDALQGMRLAVNEGPELIFLDLQLPAGGGMQMFEQLKQSARTNSIPIIFISGNKDEEVKKCLLSKGAKDFITKPYHPKDLMDSVRRVIQ